MGNTEVITLFEDTPTLLTLCETQKQDILALKSIIGENNVSLQIDGKVCISHYVGYFQKNSTRLLIYPKISRRIGDAYTCERAFDILLKMLSFSHFDHVKKVDPLKVGIYRGDLLECFVGYFAHEIILQFKRDVNRSYVNHIDNQSFIKGKIDFVKTIKKNSYRKHLHYVRYEQFTEDNLLNKIFKTIAIQLLKRTVISENKKNLQLALLWLEDVQEIAMNNAIWERIKFTRLNQQYETAFQMAKLLFYNSGPNLNRGDMKTYSFLIPVNQLFEKYVFEKLKITCEDGCSYMYQDSQFNLASQGKRNLFPLRPDIIKSSENKVIQIIDAKYKEVLSVNEALNISSSDIYQMLAYSVRYQCNSIKLVYPRFLHYREDLFIEPLIIQNYGHSVEIEIEIMTL